MNQSAQMRNVLTDANNRILKRIKFVTHYKYHRVQVIIRAAAILNNNLSQRIDTINLPPTLVRYYQMKDKLKRRLIRHSFFTNLMFAVYRFKNGKTVQSESERRKNISLFDLFFSCHKRHFYMAFHYYNI